MNRNDMNKSELAQSIDNKPTTFDQKIKFFSLLLKVLLIAILVGVQFCFILLETGSLFIINKKLFMRLKSTLYIGNMFFIGNLRGVIYDCVDCSGNKELLPKLSSIFRSYDGALVFDIGGFSPKNIDENINLFYSNFFNRINISGINLTKRDYPHIENSANLKALPLISTNIKEPKCAQGQYRKYSLITKCDNGSDKYDFSVISLSDDNKFANSNIEVESELISINNLTRFLNGNIILLYHNSEYNLEKLLYRYEGPPITLVIGCWDGNETKNIKYLNKVPYVYIETGSKNIGHVKVIQKGSDVLFDYKHIVLNSVFSDDVLTRNLMELSKK